MSIIEELEEQCYAAHSTGDRVIAASVEAPEEILAAPAWRLPGGESLAQFALRGGFVAPQLMARNSRRPR